MFNKILFMNTSSLIRVIGSPVLIAAFLFAPVSPVVSEIAMTRILSVPVAEAVAISYGSITGSVTVDGKLASDVAINVYLNDSNALASSLVTDNNGIFSFSGIQGLTYKVEVTPAIGFGFAQKASSTQIVTLNKNTEVLNAFTLDKLPAVKMFGPSIINIEVGATYEDPGVVFAKADGTVVSGYGIDGTGKVDTTTPGKYIVTYHVDDKATNGYPTIDATRTINVLPKVVNLTTLDLKKSGLTVLPTANTKIYLNSYLGKSFSNDKIEVLKLQAFLFFKEGNTSVRATGVYDAATEVAVRNFQDKYYKEILMPWGTEDNTGEVRMMTLRKINDLYNGVNTPITKDQELALSGSRKQAELNRNPVIAVEGTPLVLTVAEKTSITSKISSWWNSTKRSLVAAFPSFKKGDKDKDLVATTTALASVEKATGAASSDDNLAAAKSTKSNKVSNALIFFATIFAFLAFVVAIYIYRKTRGPVLITVEEEIEETIHVPVKAK